nr:hypothetical protein [Chloroflexia bacterium]
MTRPGARGPIQVNPGRSARGRRGRIALSLLILSLLVPLLMPIATIAAQDEEVPIVPVDEGAPPVAVLPDEPVAVIDGEAVADPAAEAAYDPALDPQTVAVEPAAGAPEMEMAPSGSLPAPPPSGAAAAATVE